MLKVISAQTISASGSFTSNTIPLTDWPKTANLKIGVAAVVSGSGTCKIEYFIPTTQTDGGGLDGLGGFIEPTGAADIGTGLTAGSYTAEFTPVVCDAIRFKVTETGGANSVTVTVYVVIK